MPTTYKGTLQNSPTAKVSDVDPILADNRLADHAFLLKFHKKPRKVMIQRKDDVTVPDEVLQLKEEQKVPEVTCFWLVCCVCVVCTFFFCFFCFLYSPIAKLRNKFVCVFF